MLLRSSAAIIPEVISYVGGLCGTIPAISALAIAVWHLRFGLVTPYDCSVGCIIHAPLDGQQHLAVGSMRELDCRIDAKCHGSTNEDQCPCGSEVPDQLSNSEGKT